MNSLADLLHHSWVYLSQWENKPVDHLKWLAEKGFIDRDGNFLRTPSYTDRVTASLTGTG